MAPARENATRPERRSRARRPRRWVLGFSLGALGVVTIIAAAAIAIYAERTRVASLLVQRYLAQYGIESDVAFDRLGWGGFLARVQAGSAGAPDFAAERIDVTLVYPKDTGLGRFTPQIARVRLVNPVLRLRYDGKTLSFGSLQKLVDSLASESGTSTAKPDVVIEDGHLLLTTPNGTIDAVAGATVSKGRLEHLKASLQRGRFTVAGVSADLASGTLTADMSGNNLWGSLGLKLDSLRRGNAGARGLDIALNLDGIAWKVENGGHEFSVAKAVGTVRTAAANARDVETADLNGRVSADAIAGTIGGGHLHATLRGSFDASAAALHRGEFTVARIGVQGSVSTLTLDATRDAWSAAAAAHVIADGSNVTYPFAAEMLSLASVHGDFGGSATLQTNGANAAIRGTLTTSGSLPRGVALRALRAQFDASGALDQTGLSGMLRTSIAASGSVAHAAARDLAHAIPGLGGDDAIAESFANALRSVTMRTGEISVSRSDLGFTVSARAPIRLSGLNGATVALRSRGDRPWFDLYENEISGAFGLEIAGGALPQVRLTAAAYRYRRGARPSLNADGDIQTSFDFGPLKGLTLTAGGNLNRSGERIVITPTRCASLAFESYRRNDAPLLTDAAVSLCGVDGRPMLVLDSSGWHFDGTLNEGTAHVVASGTAIAGATGRIQLAGSGAATRNAMIALDRATLSDLTAARRFQPIAANGTVSASGDDWRGAFKLSASGHLLGTIGFRHSLATGTGEADIDARSLAFQPNGLQPAQLAPFLANFGTRVTGGADFTGKIAWTKDETTSGGRLELSALDFQSRAGPVRQLNGTLAFRSLVPIALEPHQSFSIARIETFVPAEGVSLRFSYAPDVLTLDGASASFAGGQIALDPLTYSLKPNATTAGTVRLKDVDVAPLIAAAGLSNRISATAHIDGVVPFTIGPEGLRFANGRVAANGPGRISIKREALTSSVGIGGMGQPAPNAVQDFAYQALENLAFDQLEGTVDSRPMGRLGLILHLKGRNDPATAAEPRVGILDFLRGRAFDKPLPLPKGTPIDLTLDTSLNLDELLNAYFNRAGTAPAMAGLGSGQAMN